MGFKNAFTAFTAKVWLQPHVGLADQWFSGSVSSLSWWWQGGTVTVLSKKKVCFTRPWWNIEKRLSAVNSFFMQSVQGTDISWLFLLKVLELTRVICWVQSQSSWCLGVGSFLSLSFLQAQGQTLENKGGRCHWSLTALTECNLTETNGHLPLLDLNTCWTHLSPPGAHPDQSQCQYAFLIKQCVERHIFSYLFPHIYGFITSKTFQHLFIYSLMQIYL